VLTSLTIENWKSYEEATLNVDPLSVLIGTNSSGKSNLLDALAFLNRVASGSMLTSALQGDGLTTPLRGGVEWAARKPKNQFRIGVTFRDSETQDFVYSIACMTTAARCDLIAEDLTRVKFRDRNGKRGSENGRIHLFSTDPVDTGSPTIVARL
jgi:predicted ATPase